MTIPAPTIAIRRLFFVDMILKSDVAIVETATMVETCFCRETRSPDVQWRRSYHLSHKRLINIDG